MNKHIPRIIIAAASSGCGKTSITMGIIRFFVSKGSNVYPFKIGPDYIDPGFHSLCAERPCYNLDSILMGVEGVLNCLVKHSAPDGITIIEGVMGLYDGKPGQSSSGSTAEIAKLTHTPVIVVIDAKAAAQTIGAIALGIKLYDPECPIAGFIVNKIGSPGHYLIVKRAIEDATELPVLGWMPKCPEMILPERHLGLIAAWEKSVSDKSENPAVMADKISFRMKDSFDFNRLHELADNSAPVELKESVTLPYNEHKHYRDKIKIAVAMDNAFHFYYQDNLDILESLGAKIIFFSPVKDKTLPTGISGIYFGGGYPENHAKELEANKEIKEAIHQASQSEMPILAECGGFMYLSKTIIKDEKSYAMVGVFDIQIQMTKKLSALGYYKGTTCTGSILGRKGLSVFGHIFRWSEPLPGHMKLPSLFMLEKDGKIKYDGFKYKKTIGSYLHIHFAGIPAAAQNFIENSRLYFKIRNEQ